MHAQAQAGAVEKTMLAVKPGGAHRIVKGINLILQHQRLAGFGVDLPAALVALGDGDRLAALVCLQALQVFGEFAHQVATRNPDRQTHHLIDRGLVNGERHLEQMRLQVQRTHLIAHLGWGSGGC